MISGKKVLVRPDSELSTAWDVPRAATARPRFGGRSPSVLCGAIVGSFEP